MGCRVIDTMPSTMRVHRVHAHAGGPPRNTVPGMAQAGVRSASWAHASTASTKWDPKHPHVGQLKLAVAANVVGPDGKKHAQLAPGNFSVKVGWIIQLTLENADTKPHTFNVPAMGISIDIPAGSGGRSGVKKVSFQAKHTGTFDWTCTAPGDTYAATHQGFMRGKVTVTP